MALSKWSSGFFLLREFTITVKKFCEQKRHAVRGNGVRIFWPTDCIMQQRTFNGSIVESV